MANVINHAKFELNWFEGYQPPAGQVLPSVLTCGITLTTVISNYFCPGIIHNLTWLSAYFPNIISIGCYNAQSKI